MSVFVIGGLGMAFLQVSIQVSRRQYHSVETTSAFYVTEAGLAEAFHAVRVGRTGQIGSESAPAKFGQGLVWVDASETKDGQVRLESTGLVGAARASLALIVEPVELALGFFSDEDLIIEDVLLLDGYDAREGSHSSAVDTVMDQLNFPSTGLEQLMESMHDAQSRRAQLEAASRGYCLDDDDDDDDHNGGCSICPPPGLAKRELKEIDAELAQLRLEMQNFRPGSETAYAKSMEPDLLRDLTLAAAEGSLDHTLGGGLLGSNGSVVLGSGAGGPVEIFGEVVSGPEGSLDLQQGSRVQGETDQRATSIDLPEVEVPAVAMGPPVVHADALPMMVGSGTHGYESIVVGEGADLVISGPATVVIGELLLEPDGRLLLDTRGGVVALFLTGGMDLQPGSILETSGDVPDESSILVSSDTRNGSNPVILDATSSFHGVVYAPETEVHIGSDFEVFGSVVARKLTIGAGAKLHFENSGVGDSPIPRIVSWKLIEIPAVVRNTGGDIYELLGISKADVADLSEAHDLGSVELSLDFHDHGGNLRKYRGPEEDFDWNVVADVVSMDREPTRTKEDGAGDTGAGGDAEADGPGLLGRPDVLAEIGVFDKRNELRDYLESQMPLNDPEIRAALEREILGPGQTKKVLIGNGDLSPEILTQIITEPTEMNSNEVKDVLLAYSPLPDVVVNTLATGAPMLDITDLDEVLKAQ